MLARLREVFAFLFASRKTEKIHLTSKTQVYNYFPKHSILFIVKKFKNTKLI